MANTRVMVVDDSAAMRALFCGILENAKGIDVCGTASNAAEAREKMEALNPDVLTLDVEMPGMSGLDFLSEVMETSPMPVIMLSSITQEGTGTTQQALERGAVHCFPKPLNCSGEEFDATVQKLGDIVRRAASGELNKEEATPGDTGTTNEIETESAPEQTTASAYESDGRIVVMASGPSGLPSLKDFIAIYPAQCPPTVVIVNDSADAVQGEFEAINAEAQCNVVLARSGQTVEIGTVIIAADGLQHMMIEPGSPPRLRLVDRDPIGGFRPSADLFFGSLVRSQVSTLAGMLPGIGADGVKGLQMLAGAGNATFVQQPGDGDPVERTDAVIRLGIGAETLDREEVVNWVLETTDKS